MNNKRHIFFCLVNLFLVLECNLIAASSDYEVIEEDYFDGFHAIEYAVPDNASAENTKISWRPAFSVRSKNTTDVPEGWLAQMCVVNPVQRSTINWWPTGEPTLDVTLGAAEEYVSQPKLRQVSDSISICDLSADRPENMPNYVWSFKLQKRLLVNRVSSTRSIIISQKIRGVIPAADSCTKGPACRCVDCEPTWQAEAISLEPLPSSCPFFMSELDNKVKKCDEKVKDAKWAFSKGDALRLAYDACLEAYNLAKSIRWSGESGANICDADQHMKGVNTEFAINTVLHNIAAAEKAINKKEQAPWEVATIVLKATGRCAVKSFFNVGKVALKATPVGFVALEVTETGDNAGVILGEPEVIKSLHEGINEFASFVPDESQERNSCTGAVLDAMCGVGNIVFNATKDAFKFTRANKHSVKVITRAVKSRMEKEISHLKNVPNKFASLKKIQDICKKFKMSELNSNFAVPMTNAIGNCAGDSEALRGIKESIRVVNEIAKRCYSALDPKITPFTFQRYLESDSRLPIEGQ